MSDKHSINVSERAITYGTEHASLCVRSVGHELMIYTYKHEYGITLQLNVMDVRRLRNFLDDYLNDRVVNSIVGIDVNAGE